MGLQRPIGGIRIALADRVNDGDMLLIADAVMFIQFAIGHGWTGGDQPVEQGDVDRLKDRVAGISASTR